MPRGHKINYMFLSRHFRFTQKFNSSSLGGLWCPKLEYQSKKVAESLDSHFLLIHLNTLAQQHKKQNLIYFINLHQLIKSSTKFQGSNVNFVKPTFTEFWERNFLWGLYKSKHTCNSTLYWITQYLRLLGMKDFYVHWIENGKTKNQSRKT